MKRLELYSWLHNTHTHMHAHTHVHMHTHTHTRACAHTLKVLFIITWIGWITLETGVLSLANWLHTSLRLVLTLQPLHSQLKNYRFCTRYIPYMVCAILCFICDHSKLKSGLKLMIVLRKQLVIMSSSFKMENQMS